MVVINSKEKIAVKLKSLILVAGIFLSLVTPASAQSIADKIENQGVSKYIKITGLMSKISNGFISLQVEMANTDNEDRKAYSASNGWMSRASRCGTTRFGSRCYCMEAKKTMCKSCLRPTKHAISAFNSTPRITGQTTRPRTSSKSHRLLSLTFIWSIS